MTSVAFFTFNAFSENTYIVYDDTKECAIFDPGCSNDVEEAQLSTFIAEQQLKPIHLINTHCHIDHVFGNKYVAEKYNLPLTIHEGEKPVLAFVPQVAQMYGLPNPNSPEATQFLAEGDVLTFGNTQMDVLFTPGHSPASISFFCKAAKILIAGDVLFEGSIGRTDLPGGNFDILMNNIKQKFLPLGDEVQVFPGHGPSTTIGQERLNNPFITQTERYRKMM